MSTSIIGFAGKKQSGKNTACNAVFMMQLLKYGVCQRARMNDQGEIEVTDLFGDNIPNREWFPLNSDHVNMQGLYDAMRDHVIIYALADPLKEMAIMLFNVDRKLVYGSDKDKSQKCGLLWENMPGVTTDLGFYRAVVKASTKYNLKRKIVRYKNYRDNEMTIRELLQFLGTEVFRTMHPDAFVNGLMNRIKRDQPELALVCDVRFPNEIKAIQAAGGIVIGLQRNIDSKDKHASENVDLSLCDYMLDNREMSVQEQTHAIFELLHKHMQEQS